MIDQAVMELMRTEPFFAHLLLAINRTEDTSIPTIGVSVTDEVSLIVNPYFWDSLNLEEQTQVLKHEMMHVILNHIGRARELGVIPSEKEREEINKQKDYEKIEHYMEEHGTFNQAADFAINQYLPRLPKTLHCFDAKGNRINNEDGTPLVGKPCLIENLEEEAKKYNIKVNKLDRAEHYFDVLNQLKKKGGGKKGGGRCKVTITIDDHSVWSKSSEDPECVKAIVKSVVNGALNKAREAGHQPNNEVLLAIEKLNKPSINWKQQIQKFISRALEIQVESSRKVRNRRYGIVYPGNKIEPKLVIDVAIDTSGSIDQKLFAQFMAEINKIHQSNVKVRIIQCDAAINDIREYEPKMKIEMKGGGGTAFKPVFDEVDKAQPDGLIFFTDGYACDLGSLTKPKYHTLWAMIENCKKPVEWGSEVIVKDMGR